MASAQIPATARLTLLGGFRLASAEGEHVLSARKSRALLAAVAVAPTHRISREQICALLWGDRGEEQARASLRQALAVIRKELGQLHHILNASSELIEVDLTALAVDVAEFRHCAVSQDVDELARAAGLYQGEFLAGLTLPEQSFEDWLAGMRRNLASEAAIVMEALAIRGPSSQRVSYAQRLVSLDPLRESSLRLLMQAHAAAGDRSLALRQYDQLRKLLRDELGVEPAAETQQLKETIAAGAYPVPSATVIQAPPFTSEPPKTKPTIAVLPFENVNRDSAELYLSDGITEDVIASLSRFRQLAVISRNSSFAFRGSNLRANEIGAKLGVSFVLTGTVMHAGSRIRVTTSLIDVATDATLWAGKFDHNANDVFGMIDQLSAEIVAAAVGRIEDELLRRSRRKPAQGFAAYELILRGRALMHAKHIDSVQNARSLFEEAARLEPDSALAHTQIALAHLSEFFFDDSGAALDKAGQIASRAIEIDEDEPWSHMILALTHLHQRKYGLALQYGARATALNPNDPKLVSKHALILIDCGKPDDAIPFIHKAMKLNPHEPEDYNDYLALAHYAARRYAEARDAMQMLPDTTYYYHVWMAAISYRMNDLENARKHRQRAMELAPEFSIARFTAMEPIRDPADLAHWTDALKGAGFA